MYERMREQGKEMEFKVAPEKQQKIWSALIGKCMKETPQDLLKAVRSHIKGFDLSNTANIMHRACKVLTLGLPKSWLATQPPQEAMRTALDDAHPYDPPPRPLHETKRSQGVWRIVRRRVS